jgi:hypothetical protein
MSAADGDPTVAAPLCDWKGPTERLFYSTEYISTTTRQAHRFVREKSSVDSIS